MTTTREQLNITAGDARYNLDTARDAGASAETIARLVEANRVAQDARSAYEVAHPRKVKSMVRIGRVSRRW